ncbi:MAG TPA: DNA recombination protein RmuC, partial [Acetobacteraceae bacterium]|nr:DNA recombination protein RmuC [Acetobacteraceae bacterium]
ETFARQNRTQIDATLAPLREKLQEFQQGLQTAHTESVTGRALLAAQIARLSEDSAKVRAEAENLATALRGEAQMRGAWGEMILDRILDLSGLVKGVQFLTQQSYVTAEGRRLQADVVVPLPNGQSLVIDSKVSLNAFEAYVNAAEEEPRAASLRAHVAALRAQISDLSGKAYHAVVPGSPDFVIMFVPIEAALAAAVQADRDLIGFATESRVSLATPTTLMIALRTAANVWQVENRNRNAEQIASRAGLLYDKLVSFVGDMETLNRKLGEAHSAYDSAMKRLATGSGNVLRQAQQLKDMGAKATKSLPAALLDAAEGEAAAAAD